MNDFNSVYEKVEKQLCELGDDLSFDNLVAELLENFDDEDEIKEFVEATGADVVRVNAILWPLKEFLKKEKISR